MFESLSDQLGHYGYVLLGLFLFVEAIGLPIPGETALVTAAALAGHGSLSIWGVFLSATIGTTTGCMSGYWLGVRNGPKLVARFGRALRIDDKRLERARVFFESHGAKALFIGRFVAVLRSFLGMFAGVSGMERRRFLIYNAVGGAAWSAVFCALGFVFGRNLPRVIHQLGRASLVLAIVVGVLISLRYGLRWFEANRQQLTNAIDKRWERLMDAPGMQAFRDRYPRAWELVASRFAGSEYLAMHLIVGLLVSFGALGVFATITEDVIEGAPLTPIDQAVANWLHASVSPQVLALFAWISAFGSPWTTAILAFAIAGLLVARRRWLGLATWAAAYIGTVLLDVALRGIVHGAELPSSAALPADAAVPLPTGHTIGTIVAYGFAVYVLRRLTSRPVARGLIVGAGSWIIAGIITSRLFLGLGYLSTEAAAVTCGVLWLATCVSGLELARRQPQDPGAAMPVT